MCTTTFDVCASRYTGKDRDTESGLDYFGARYYSSSAGRFVSADWAAMPTAVPYASFGNPQSLNLYAYAGNNPNTNIDVDGHFTDPANSQANAQQAAAAGPGQVTAAQQAAMDDDFLTGAVYLIGTPSYLIPGLPGPPAQQQGGLKGPFGVPKSGPIRDEFEKDAKSGAKGFIGDKWCVTACKHFAPGLENYSTPHWRPGDPASGLTAADRGTAIATFVNDRFENGGDQNSAIYLGPGPTPGSIVVLDQFPHPSHPPGPRLIEPDSSTGHVISNSAQYYHVILVQP